MNDLNKQKVTIYFRSMMGYRKVEARAFAVESGTYAQYSNVKIVKFLEPRKRKARAMRDTGGTNIVILNGWGHPNPDDGFTAPEVTPTGCIVRKSRHACFSPAYDAEFNEFMTDYMAREEVEVILDNRGLNPYARTENAAPLTTYADVNPF